MSSGANDEVKVLQFAAFRDHGWGHVVVYPSWLHVLKTKTFQSPNAMVLVQQLRNQTSYLGTKYGL